MYKKMWKLPLVCLLCLSSCVSPPSQEQIEKDNAARARINLALAYLAENEYPKAKENIDKALAHNEKNYLVHSVQAYYFQQIGEIEAAEKSYQQALLLSRNAPDVLNNYGAFLCRQGKSEAANQAFEQALNAEQPYYSAADTLENMILCAKANNEPAKVATLLQRLENYDKARADALKSLK